MTLNINKENPFDSKEEKSSKAGKHVSFQSLLTDLIEGIFAIVNRFVRWDHKKIESVYKGKIEDVDLMVGMFGETPPQGFGFSDTAFRIFILMASRRLNSDRFFTTDYTPEVYTQAGLDWVANNSMISVLLRHYPKLEPALRLSKNAFAPWQRVGT